jgi:hypothetical protein
MCTDLDLAETLLQQLDTAHGELSSSSIRPVSSCSIPSFDVHLRQSQVCDLDRISHSLEPQDSNTGSYSLVSTL